MRNHLSNHHLSDQELVGYIHHTLTDADREGLERHLAQCPDCRARLSDCEALRQNIQASLRTDLRSAQPSAQMTFAAIQPRLRHSGRFTMFLKRSRQLVFSAMALMAFAAFVIVIWTLFANMSRPFDNTVRAVASPAPQLTATAPNPVLTATAPITLNVIGGQVSLEDWDLSMPRLAPGAPFTLTLYWKPLRKLDDNFVYVHLLDASGRLVAQHDAVPAGGARPTSAWEIGEQVVDAHVLQLPTDLAPQSYHFQVGMYAAASGQALGETSPQMAIVALPPVTETVFHTVAPGNTFASIVAQYGLSLRRLLQANALSSDTTLRVGDVLWIPNDDQVVFGGQAALAGLAWQESAGRDNVLIVTLYWQAPREITRDYTSFVHLVDNSMRVLAQHDNIPANGAHPTSGWKVGEQIADLHTLMLPAGVSGARLDGEYDLEIGLYDVNTGERVIAPELFPENQSLDGQVVGSVLLSHLMRSVSGVTPETIRRANWSWPVNNGERPYGFDFSHRAWDWDGQPGEPIRAVATGTVQFAGWNQEGYGYLVVLEHADGVQTWYAHLQDIAVKPNQTLYPGDQVGRMGSTGNATGVHLHFEVRNDSGPIDPAQYLVDAAAVSVEPVISATPTLTDAQCITDTPPMVMWEKKGPAFEQAVQCIEKLSRRWWIMEEPALAWEGREQNEASKLLIATDGNVGIGCCGGLFVPLGQRSITAKWPVFQARFAPFQYETPEEKLVFKGMGNEKATLAWQRAIAAWARASYGSLYTGNVCASCPTRLYWYLKALKEPQPRAVLLVTEYGDVSIAPARPISDAISVPEITPIYDWLTTDEMELFDAWLYAHNTFQCSAEGTGEAIASFDGGLNNQNARPMSEAEFAQVTDWIQKLYARLTRDKPGWPDVSEMDWSCARE